MAHRGLESDTSGFAFFGPQFLLPSLGEIHLTYDNFSTVLQQIPAIFTAGEKKKERKLSSLRIILSFKNADNVRPRHFSEYFDRVCRRRRNLTQV